MDYLQGNTFVFFGEYSRNEEVQLSIIHSLSQKSTFPQT